MNKIHRMILLRPIGLHYFLVLLSTILLMSSIKWQSRPGDTLLIVSPLLSFVLLITCLLYIWAQQQYSRYEYFSKRIRYEFKRIAYKQQYKLKRLSKMEEEVLILLLREYTLDQMALSMKISHLRLYRYIRRINSKLDITREELLDIYWDEVI